LKFERRLIGVLVMSLIVGSLISLYLIRERIETPINIIDESYPKTALAGSSELDQDKYSLAFVCREDLKRVEMRFCYLMQVDPTMDDPGAKVDKPESAGEMVEEIEREISLMGEMGYEPEVTVTEVMVDGGKKRVVIYDFACKLNEILPANGSSYYRSVYAVSVNRSDMIDGFYEGVSDFAFLRDFSLQSLEITKNANKTTYMATDEETDLQEGAFPIRMAPKQGRILFTDLKRNDRISLVYRSISRSQEYPTLFRKRLTGARHLIHVAKIEVNGELAEDKLLVHIITNDAYEEA
jgi:hypothetical protein